MKIFIVSKVPRGNAVIEQTAQTAAAAVRAAGHQACIAYDEIAAQDLTDHQIFMPFARRLLASCDGVLVLYHPELRGGLIEMGMAYALDKPIWLAFPTSLKVSSSALGCASAIAAYASLDELSRIVTVWLK